MKTAEKCWFCEDAPSQQTCAAVVEMHKGDFAGDTRNYLVSDTDTLFVPRCERCKSVHERVEGFVAKGGLLGLGIGVVLIAAYVLIALGPDAIVSWRTEIATFTVLLIAPCLAGGTVAWAIARVLVPRGVKDQRAREHHHSIVNKVRDGWKVGPRPPGL